jgi:YD repeat-containing protein
VAALALAALAAPAFGASTSYQYDVRNQLTRVVYADGRQASYSYDDMGNLLSITVANTSAPIVLVTDAITGTIHQPVPDYQILASVPADVTAYKATGLPAGLKYNGGTVVNADGKAPGVIYGTPSVSGLFRATLRARSVIGSSSATTLFVNIGNPWTRMEDGYDLAGKAQARIAASAITGGEIGGWLDLTVSQTGGFTGKLTLGSKKYTVKGQFDSQFGTASVVVDRPEPLTDLTLNLVLWLEGSMRGALTGSLQEGATTAALDGIVSPWGPANRATVFSGARGATYNVALMIDAAINGNDAYPQGAGYFTAKFTTAGGVQLAGRLADGTAFSGATTVARTGDAPVFIPLYGAKGVLNGELQASDAGSVDRLADNTLAGTVTWQHPAIPGALYPAGFPAPMTLHVMGGVYIAPARGFRVLDLGNGATHSAVELSLLLGGVSPSIDSNVIISTGNTVTAFMPNNNTLALTFNATAGLFTGRFTVPSPARTTTFQGMLVPASAAGLSFGAGYFLLPGPTPSSPTLSGRALIVQPLSP